MLSTVAASEDRVAVDLIPAFRPAPPEAVEERLHAFATEEAVVEQTPVVSALRLWKGRVGVTLVLAGSGGR